jgi:hypothetical protein
MPKYERSKMGNLMESLERIANRVYRDDLTKRNGSVAYIRTMRRDIEKENYTDAVNPYQILFNTLRSSWPEILTDGGGALLQNWL